MATIIKPGMTFGEWEVLEFIGDRKWLCKCSCGTIKPVHAYQLTSGRSKSCGHNSGALKDLRGQKFGELEPIEYVGKMKWLCKCSCGKEVVVNRGDLKSGNTKSCGHLSRGRKVIDLKDKKIGDWTVLEHAYCSYWKCKCSCGTERLVHSYSLRNGKSLNCGSTTHKEKDLTNMIFGELKAVKSLGNMQWLCKCSCGNMTIIRSANLVNGSTRSCGCKTQEIRRNTLLQRYGEISSSKANSINKRTIEQLEILTNKENLESFTVRLKQELNRNVTVYDLVELLNVTPTTLRTYFRQFQLDELIKSGKLYSKSHMEIEVADKVKSFGVEIITNSKKIIPPYELDIYIPDKKIAIEFNGTYWHSTIYKDRLYHQNKTIECAKQGIRLIHIFEYEWDNLETKEKIIRLLERVLGNSNKRIYARNTAIKQISKEDARDFLDVYHLQKSTASSIQYGLYENSELLGVMTFGKPRFNNSFEYELIRLAWKDNISVIGGSEKLFNTFIKEQNPSSVISYCDISKFTGKVYERLRFKASVSNITEPNYVWVNPQIKEVLSRYKTRKQKLLNNGLGEYGDTEDNIMENLGYLKIYDCGNLRFTWNK